MSLHFLEGVYFVHIVIFVSTSRQSAYRRLKENRDALTSKQLSKMEHSLSCARHVFASSLLRACAPSPTFVQPAQKAGADRHARIRLRAFTKYKCQS